MGFIDSFANAIAQAEGFGGNLPDGSPNSPTRNHNPGDLKPPAGHEGEYTTDSKGHIIFGSDEEGYAALKHQLDIIFTGQSKNYNSDMTIDEMAKKYSGDSQIWAKNVSHALGVSSNAVLKDLANGEVVTKDVSASAGTPSATDGVQKVLSAYQPLDNVDITDAQFLALTPPTLVTTGLDEIPWYDDTQHLITGNPLARKRVTPVSFRVMLRDGSGAALYNPQTKAPIDIQLNCSLRSQTTTMRHVYTKTNTRTGIHITLWGMQADIIEGQCSTGVFMNQFGLTDYMSMAKADDQLKKVVTSGLMYSFNRGADGSAEVYPATSESPMSFEQLVSKRTQGGNPDTAFRVAAQDAFMEFLALFKYNGNVWFQQQKFSENFTSEDQAGPSVWSPKAGMSDTAMHARNNDAFTRYFIQLRMKGQTYLGYFKSLAFTKDAKAPFQWNFNFVFQVERTINLMYSPR